MQYVILTLLAYSLIGAFLAAFLGWEEDTYVIAIAPVVVILVLVGLAVEFGYWLRRKTKGR